MAGIGMFTLGLQGNKPYIILTTTNTSPTWGFIGLEMINSYVTITRNGVTEPRYLETINVITFLTSSNNPTTMKIEKNFTHISPASSMVTSLDISNCLTLNSVNCYNNQLTELDVSNNINLTNLRCSYNQLTELDVSKNINLTSLDCRNNNISVIKINANQDTSSWRKDYSTTYQIIP